MPKRLRKHPLFVAVACAVLIGASAWGVTYYLNQRANQVKLVLGSGASSETFVLENARSQPAQVKGLSGRSGLAPRTGMLFTFAAPLQQQCMWMKDMRFAIDIIWLDADKKVTRIEPKLTPETYPQSYCAEAQYVVELPAGTAGASGLAVGQTLRF